MNSSARQRKESKKSAQTAKQQNRNHSKKTSNENNSTVCARKTATTGEKTQGKKQTTGKNYFERKINFAQTVKARKGARTAKYHNEVGQASPKQVANRATIFFRFQF